MSNNVMPNSSVADMPDRSLLMDRSVPGRRAVDLPAPDVPLAEMPDDALLRQSDDLQLPEVSQLDVIRYFTLLSRLNFSIDTNFYPLGSCTMKYNPKLNDQIASLGGFANIHPLQDDESVQGALEVMFELQEWLGEATGLPGVGLAPLAGAQGEYAGLLIARAALEMRGESHRNVALIPDSAHGTNPASAAMAGLSVVTIKTDQLGNVDVEDLRAKADENTCVFMLTIPSTLGLFEPNIIEINNIIHDAGGLVYADGANLNALLGLVKLGDLGVDICHSNLHKTFSTPHGGGGPGAGPVMVTEELASFLPEPVVVKSDSTRHSSSPTRHSGSTTRHSGESRNPEGPGHDTPTPSPSQGDTNSGSYHLTRPDNSIGKINGFHGSFSILVRAYTYMQSLGGDGLRAVVRERRHQRELHPSDAPGPLRPRGRPLLHARDRIERQATSRPRRPRSQHRQTTTRLRHPRSHHVLPPHRPRGADGRTHRDRVERDPRPLRSRHASHRRRDRQRSRQRKSRPAHPPKHPTRRSDGCEAAGVEVAG